MELHLLWNGQGFGTLVNHEFLLLGHASVVAAVGPTTRDAHELTLGGQWHISPLGPHARYLIIILADHLVVCAAILSQLGAIN